MLGESPVSINEVVVELATLIPFLNMAYKEALLLELLVLLLQERLIDVGDNPDAITFIGAPGGVEDELTVTDCVITFIPVVWADAPPPGLLAVIV